jgi:hypothetical protein
MVDACGGRGMKALTIWQPYLAGVLHGDGWCTPLTLGLRSKDRDFAGVFAEAVNALFGTALQSKTDERGYWLVRASNKSGRFNDLKDYEPSDDKERAAWLRGLFDSEGNAQILPQPRRGPNSYHRRVAFYSTNFVTLGLAASHLHSLDIKHLIRSTKNSATHKGLKLVGELRLCRREAFQTFARIVGSSIERKQARLDAIAASYQPDGWQGRNWVKAAIVIQANRKPA